MPEMAADLPSDGQDNEKMPAMGFLEHLEELRKRIIYSLIAVGLGFFACWGYAENIYSIMQRPIMEALHKNGLSEKLVYLNPTEPFNLYLKVGFLAGLFVASPFVLYQVWLFISPGLYRNEKRYVVPFMFSTVGLFLAGGYFGYKLVYPQALEFLIGYGKQFQPMITIGEYTDLFLTIIIGMRGVFIVAGVGLIRRFHWIVYIFGLLLIWSGIKLLRQGDEEIHPEKNPVLRMFRRWIPVSNEYEGSKFWVRKDRLYATPLLVVLLMVETTDVLFAMDSIPAVLAITLNAFIVYTSNVFAILGLRSMVAPAKI